MRNYETKDETKEPNPMLGLIGFIILVVVAGLSFAVSGAVVNWLQTTQFALGATGIHVLPMQFPAGWPLIANQLAVSFGLFIVIFGLIMLGMISVMKPTHADERDVTIDEMRRERKAKKRGR